MSNEVEIIKADSSFSDRRRRGRAIDRKRVAAYVSITTSVR